MILAVGVVGVLYLRFEHFEHNEGENIPGCINISVWDSLISYSENPKNYFN